MQFLVNGTPIGSDPGNDSNVDHRNKRHIHGLKSENHCYASGGYPLRLAWRGVNLKSLQTNGTRYRGATVQHGLWTGAKVSYPPGPGLQCTNSTITVLDPWLQLRPVWDLCR